MNFKKSIIASTLGCAVISFPLFLAACGDDKSNSANDGDIKRNTRFYGSRRVFHPLHKEVEASPSNQSKKSRKENLPGFFGCLGWSDDYCLIESL
ncbi:hypothetical protein [Fibrobacter sp.]|uniref:hypothetical protein n=1 Tax=Fibrobacter sp. TaxID=35828 RepID=UPI003870186E